MIPARGVRNLDPIKETLMSENARVLRNVSILAAVPLALGAVLVLGSCCGRHGSHGHAAPAATQGGCCASETPAASPAPVAAHASGGAHAPAAEPAPAPAPAGRPPARAAVAEQTNCPVLGGPIDKSVFIEYQSKKVYFCCQGCPDVFPADPAKYIAKLPQFAQGRIGGPNQ